MAQDVQKRDAIRIQVIKCAGLYQPEYKTFSVDPEITNFPMLHNLLSQAFQLQNEFTISYLSRDEKGVEVYLSLLSDWDLDAAFLSASDPVLKLKVDARPFEGPGLDDWDVISMKDTTHRHHHERSMSMPFVGNFMDSVGRTLNRVQKMFQGENNDGKVYELPLKPLDDKEFLTYLDEGGRLVNKEGLMLRVFQGGVEPSLRKTVWRHLLNIFPPSMSGEERWAYLKLKDKEYHALKDRLLNNPREDFKNVMNMVRKDVLRTDRLESFYSSGADENPNGVKLFNILTTYALSHPDISYCQGMSDLASPILYVMQDEAQAYLCFVGLMKRLRGNFLIDGKTMSVKFLHLTELIKVSDPEFYNYLREENADDLYFCYRWLLLELKREFAFQDVFRMLEVMWSAVPPNDPPETGIELSGPPSNMSPTPFATDKMRFKFARERANSKRRSGSLSSLRTASVENDDGLRISQKDLASTVDLEVFEKEDDNNQGSCDPKKLEETSDFETSDETDNVNIKQEEEKTDILETNKNQENIMSDVEISDSGKPCDSAVKTSSASPRRSLPKIPNDSSFSNSSGKKSNLYINCNATTNWETQGNIPETVSLSAQLSNDDLEVDMVTTTDVPEISVTSSEEMSVTSNGENSVTSSDSNQASSNQENHSRLSSPKTDSVPSASSNASSSKEPTSPSSSSSHKSNTTSSKSHPTKSPSNSKVPFLLSSLEKKIAELTTTSKPTNLPLNSQPTEGSKSNKSSPMSPVRRPYRGLPTPKDFGMGNPFMMFLCLTLLLEQREYIMALKMDYNDMAMLFDRMVRKHDLNRMLCKARDLYIDYLKAEISFGYWEEGHDRGVTNGQESPRKTSNGEVMLARI